VKARRRSAFGFRRKSNSVLHDLDAAAARRANFLAKRRRRQATLTLVKSVTPVYPAKAKCEQDPGLGRIGFIHSVRRSCERPVKDIAVPTARPCAPGVFEDAAISASLTQMALQARLGATPRNVCAAVPRVRIPLRFWPIDCASGGRSKAHH